MMAGGTLCIFKEGCRRHCVWHFTRHSVLCIYPLVSNTHWNVTHTWITLQFCLSVCDCLVEIMHYAFYLPMIATDGLCILKQRCSFECNWLKRSYYTLEQYIMFVGALFRYLAMSLACRTSKYIWYWLFCKNN